MKRPKKFLNCLGCLAAALAGQAALAQTTEFIEHVRRDVRNDGMAEKLRLIEEAYAGGDYDLALALSESIKYTVELEKQLNGSIGELDISADAARPVSELPAAWAAWAAGWQYVTPVTVSETAGIDRADDPVDLVIAFSLDATTDLYREVRVAQIDGGGIREVPSQVYDAVTRDRERQCHLVFFGNAPANGAATYLVFFGNPLAELPAYPTDLKVSGEGYGLDIASEYYTAQLSRQTGQMERIRFAREHGLELYAGGKGHGEHPTVDWSNDYVDEDHYQKLRIRNWAAPPNYEVVRGPLCVRVRRWGFPHSPIHPLFAPSRMLIDQTYIFYAGKDYFLKEGVMRAAKDMEIATMRDDEWVLSGYSFTDKLWFDSDGHFQTGDVPSDQAEVLWGTGFYNRDSGDLFLGLWLDHEAGGVEKLLRNAGPILHYHQHGQLWSRSPVGGGQTRLAKGAYVRDRNAYLLGEYPADDPAATLERRREQLLQPLAASAGALPGETRPTAVGALARDGETTATAPLKTEIWTALKDVQDEQLYKIDSNVVDLGYIYDVKVRNGVAEILMTMPHKGRGVYQYLEYRGGGRNSEGIRERLLHIDGIDDVVVDFTWDPPWTASRLTEAGRHWMGLDE